MRAAYIFQLMRILLICLLIGFILCAFTLPYFSPVVHAPGAAGLRWLLAVALILLILNF